MTILRAVALVLIVLAFAEAPARAATAAPAVPAGQKIETSNLDGLAYIVTIPKPTPKNKKAPPPRPAPFGAVPETGHTLTIQGGKLLFTIEGLPPIPPIAFQAYKTGDLIKIVTTDGVEVIDKANKSTLIGSLLIAGAISDSGKSFIGTMTWSVGETKAKRKVEFEFDGAKPEKPNKK